MPNGLQSQINCRVQEVLPTLDRSLSLLKDAEKIGCRNGIGRSGDGDGLIKLAQVDERVRRRR